MNGNLSDNGYSGGNVNDNPNVVALDISAVAGNQDSVYVRFQYYSPDTNLTSVDPAAGCGYSWMIDDVSITKIEQVDGKLIQAYAGEYTVLPILQAEAFTLQGRFINNGVDPISGAQIYFTVLDPIGNFYYDTSNVSGTVNPGDTSSNLISSGSYLPAGFGEYLIDQTLVVANDSDNTNDLSTGRVLVDDSIYARDFTVFENDDFRGSIGLQGQTVSFAEKFHIYQLSQFTSVSVYLDNPTLGDTINLSVHNSLAGMPSASIGATDNYTITANDTIGVFLTFPFPAPVTVNPGDYFVAINQQDTNFLTLGLSENIYTPDANFFNISGGGWFPLENANLKRALLLRVNNPEGTLNSVKENKNKSTFNLYPNPTNGVIYITGNGIQEKEVTVRIVNGLGQVVKFATYDSFIFSRIDLSEFSAGIYTVNVSTASGEESKNIILQ